MDEEQQLRRDLAQYRGVLHLTTDPRAVAALDDLIGLMLDRLQQIGRGANSRPPHYDLGAELYDPVVGVPKSRGISAPTQCAGSTSEAGAYRSQHVDHRIVVHYALYNDAGTGVSSAR
jgi:hypothetical protein